MGRKVQIPVNFRQSSKTAILQKCPEIYVRIKIVIIFPIRMIPFIILTTDELEILFLSNLFQKGSVDQ